MLGAVGFRVAVVTLGSMPEPASRPSWANRLETRREEFVARGKLYRVAFVTAGFTVLLAGLAMLVLPGPALVVIPLGLAMLSLQFAWAERMLDHALDRAEAAKQKAADSSRTEKALGFAATALGIAAFVACAVLYDIPLLPV